MWNEVIGDKLDKKIWCGTLPSGVVEMIIDERRKLYMKCIERMGNFTDLSEYLYRTYDFDRDEDEEITIYDMYEDYLDEIYEYVYEEIMKQINFLFTNINYTSYRNTKYVNSNNMKDGFRVNIYGYMVNVIMECINPNMESMIIPIELCRNILNVTKKKKRYTRHIDGNIFMYRLKYGQPVLRIHEKIKRIIITYM